MSKNKHLPKNLPEKNPYFSIEIEGDVTKHKYVGDFESIIPNIKIQTKIAKYKAYLNGGYDSVLDATTKNLHHMASYCKMCLVDAPEWFTEADWGLDLYDVNVLEEVFNKILTKESEWLESIWGKNEQEEAGEEEAK